MHCVSSFGIFRSVLDDDIKQFSLLEDDSDDKRYHNLYSDTSCCATDIAFDEYITREVVHS
jgi:hypothetical protein